MQRVAITGLGSVNALGTGVERFACGLRKGRCAIGPLSVLLDAGFRSTCAAEAKDLRLPESVPVPTARRASRSTQLALIATAEALTVAGLGSPAVAGQAAVVLGTTTGGMSRGEDSCRRFLLNEPPQPPPVAWLESSLAAPTEAVVRTFNLLGPRLTLSTACSSGAHALSVAADWIRRKRAHTVVCGGVDALCQVTYAGFDALHALDIVPCRPFDVRRAGLSLGEGAAVFVLEAWDHARARGASVMAEFVSCGASADAHHPAQPRPDGAGASLAMRAALEEGDIDAEEIDYINAHGTGTPLNDLIETRAIKSVFGSRAYRIPVSSTKSMIGHCLGAAGAIEALASVIALQEQFVPPTATLELADPECDLDYVPQASRPAVLQTVLSNSYGFGGNNTSLIFRSAPD